MKKNKAGGGENNVSVLVSMKLSGGISANIWREAMGDGVQAQGKGYSKCKIPEAGAYMTFIS